MLEYFKSISDYIFLQKSTSVRRTVVRMALYVRISWPPTSASARPGTQALTVRPVSGFKQRHVFLSNTVEAEVYKHFYALDL